jgi:hypothetical protein
MTVYNCSRPADCPVLFGQIRAPVKIVRVRENLLHLFESDASFRVGPQPFTFPPIEVKSHEYNSYTI